MSLRRSALRVLERRLARRRRPRQRRDAKLAPVFADELLLAQDHALARLTRAARSMSQRSDVTALWHGAVALWRAAWRFLVLLLVGLAVTLVSLG
jgi:hypothetical protein